MHFSSVFNVFLQFFKINNIHICWTNFIL